MLIGAQNVKPIKQEPKINPNAGTLRYFNAKNKQNFTTVAFISRVMRDIIEPLHLEKENKKMANMCATLAHKLMINLVDGLDEDAKREIVRAIGRYDIEIVQKGTIDDAEIREQEGYLSTLAEHALQGSCLSCTKEGNDIENCELRVAMIYVEVPVFDETCPSGRCLYKVEC